MKEIKPLEFLLLAKKPLKSRQALHRIFLKPQYKVYRGASISIPMHPFLMFSLFQNYLNPRLERTNGKQYCLPPLYFKVSLKANKNIY